MGSEGSKSYQWPVPTDYLAVSLFAPNRLVIIVGESRSLALIQHIVQSKWPKGISGQRPLNGAFEMKLCGSPLADRVLASGTTLREAVAAVRAFICEFLAQMSSHRWQLVACHYGKLDICSTLYFKRKTEQELLITSENVACVGPRCCNRLQLIGRLERHLPDTVAAHYALSCGVEVKVAASAWNCTSFEDIADTHRLILSLIRRLHQDGYQFLTACAVRKFIYNDSYFFLKSSKSDDSSFCLMSLHKKDRIRLMEFPPNLISVIECVLQEKWSKGVQQKRPSYLGCAEFKLCGNPWFKDKSVARSLICAILKQVLSHGYTVSGVIGLSMRETDMATFIFESCIPTEVNMCCLTPCKQDVLQLINGTQQTRAIISTAIVHCWNKGIISCCMYSS